jgi:lipopolysaccharide export system protein LptA
MTARPLLLAALLLSASPACAQNLDLTGGGPIEITSSNGIEWRQADQVVVALGNARAARDGVAVEAERLIARYRPRGGAQQPANAAPGASPVSGSEIWRLEAEGRVRITSATERAEGSRAVYDMDQSVMVLSGQGLSLTTPDQRVTARDSLEYWPGRRMAVARGGAVVTTEDNRRITADTLVAHFLDAPTSRPRPPPRPPRARRSPGCRMPARAAASTASKPMAMSRSARPTRSCAASAASTAR